MFIYVPHPFPIHITYHILSYPHLLLHQLTGFAGSQMGASRVHTVATMAQHSSCWV